MTRYATPVGVPEDLSEAVVVLALDQVRIHQTRPEVGAGIVYKLKVLATYCYINNNYCNS